MTLPNGDARQRVAVFSVPKRRDLAAFVVYNTENGEKGERL